MAPRRSRESGSLAKPKTPPRDQAPAKPEAEPLPAIDLPAPTDVLGFVEDVVEIDGIRHLKGWAFDVANPADPLVVTVMVDGKPLADLTCGLPRADLGAAGLARPNSGYLWPVPPALVDGGHHGIAVRASNGADLPLVSDKQSYDALWRPLDPAPEPVPTMPPQCQLFDEPFYRAENPGVVAPNASAWAHFVLHGATQGRNPSPLFDLAIYRDANPPPPDPSENPLLHFERTGRSHGWRHHWLFDGAEYLRLNPDVPASTDALAHFIAYGLPENRHPSVLFEPDYYLARYPDVARSGMPAFAHFLHAGDREGRAPSPLFDPDCYKRQAADLGGMGTLEHYVRAGGLRRPHPLFETRFYQSAHPDSVGVFPTLLHHYIESGAARGYDPHPAFDTAHYLRAALDPAARRNPLRHYITAGARAGLSPNALFDPAYYAAQPARRTWDGKELPRSGPRISVIVPVFNTPPDILRACLDSVLAQTYASWELCIVDDGSRSAPTAAALAAYRGRDPRIRIDRTTTNLHIARATNRAVLQATGEFVAFLDHDDTIEPDALAQIAAAIMADPQIDLLYTDEDKLDEQGRPTQPYHKPDWSPEHLHSVMYVLHMLVVRKSLFWAVGGSRPERTGAQDYDLVLRAAARARRVHHIPRILYHWRMLPGSAAGDTDAKPYALEAARAALQDVVATAMPGASVEDGLLRGTFRVRPSLAAQPPVTLLIFTHDAERDVDGRGPINLIRNFVGSIAEKSTYRNYKLLVIDNANSSDETKALVERVGGAIAQYRVPGPFNYAKKANFATSLVETEHLIYLNDDMEVITPDWIEALLELSTRPEVGVAGARLLYPDGRIQHSGIILGVHGAAGHAFVGLGREMVGANAYTHLIRNYSAVTGAVFATRRSVLDEVGGYDERLAIDFNDIDLCLRIGQAGRRIAFTPFAELYHFEGSTALRTTQDPAEREFFLSRWGGVLANDPFYNPNLPRGRLGFA